MDLFPHPGILPHPAIPDPAEAFREQLPRAALPQGREDGDRPRRSDILHACVGWSRVGPTGVLLRISESRDILHGGSDYTSGI